ncbi:MAG: HAD family hydrolase, partial [Varibaculum cambriense]|nr:HAD family hydrolase [Varibaculum cambriense]
MYAEENLKFPTEFYDAYIFVMDGTIYLGDHPLPAAKRLTEELPCRAIPV